MGWVVNSMGKQYFKYPIAVAKFLGTPVAETLKQQHDPTGSGNPDDVHEIAIDAVLPNTDQAHVYLQGVLAADDFFIRCNNPSKDDASGDADLNDVFTLDGDGNIKCNEIASPDLQDIREGIIEVDEAVEDNSTAIQQNYTVLLEHDDRINANLTSLGHKASTTSLDSLENSLVNNLNLELDERDTQILANQESILDHETDLLLVSSLIENWAKKDTPWIKDDHGGIPLFDHFSTYLASVVANQTVSHNFHENWHPATPYLKNEHNDVTLFDHIDGLLNEATDTNITQDIEISNIIQDLATLAIEQSTFETETDSKFLLVNNQISVNDTQLLTLKTVSGLLDGDPTVSSTSAATPHSLMKRDTDGGCSVAKLTADVVVSSGGHTTTGSGAFFYMPLTETSSPRMNGSTKSFYRFGRGPVDMSVSEANGGPIILTNFTGEEDGVHMENDGLKVELYASKERPVFEINGTMDDPHPYIKVKRDDNEIVFEVGKTSTWATNLNTTDLLADVVKCKTLESTELGGFTSIRVKTLIADNSSVWLGNKLHVSESGTARLRMRKATIPKYLQTLSPAVVSGDLSTVVEDVALSEWQALSVARGGSDELSVIFPEANASDDFETNSKFNEVTIQPDNPNQGDSGLTIRNELGGHPHLVFEGSQAEGDGRGLIIFKDVDTSPNQTMVYNSPADNDFHIDTFSSQARGSDVVLECANLRLAGNSSDIVRNGVGVFEKIAELEASSSGLGNEVVIESSTENSSLTVKSDRDAGKSASITIRADSDTANTGLADRVYEFSTEPSNGDTLLCSALGSPAFRLFAGGRITFGNISSSGAANFQVEQSAWFRNSMKITGAVEVVSTLTLPGYSDVAQTLDTIPSVPTLVYGEDNMGTTEQLNDDVRVLVWGKEAYSSGQGNYYMPEDPQPPYLLDIFGGRPFGGGDITLKINVAATALGHRFHQSNDTDNAVAYVSSSAYVQYVLKNTGGRHIKCVFIPATKRWLVAH